MKEYDTEQYRTDDKFLRKMEEVRDRELKRVMPEMWKEAVKNEESGNEDMEAEVINEGKSITQIQRD